jgi:hypothetical protein
MKDKRCVILFGAGAVIDWGAPSTPELTNHILKSGFYIKGESKTITQFIYETLLYSNQYSANDINFETIINVIEELIVYYSEYGLSSKKPSIINSFFNAKFEREIFNFSILSGEGNHCRLSIPGISDEFSEYNHNGLNPPAFFLIQLLSNLLTALTVKIERYSYHTNGHTKVMTDDNANLNRLFSHWIKAISNENIVRMYTLNYDRNFKIIIEESGALSGVFEGFESGPVLGYNDAINPNIKRIVEDIDSHTHYNMHGSVFWHIEPRNVNMLEIPEVYLTCRAHLEVNTLEHAIHQNEQGKSIVFTNIITGYQKTQKAIFPPIRQMQSAFDRDCINADVLYVVGYSFADEHINSMIRTALVYNENLIIRIIDPGFTKNRIDELAMFRIFSALDLRTMQAHSFSNEKHQYFNGKIVAHAITFKRYLEKFEAESIS